MPSTPRGIVYPDASGGTDLWTHFANIGETTDDALDLVDWGSWQDFETTSAWDTPHALIRPQYSLHRGGRGVRFRGQARYRPGGATTPIPTAATSLSPSAPWLIPLVTSYSAGAFYSAVCSDGTQVVRLNPRSDGGIRTYGSNGSSGAIVALDGVTFWA